MIINMRIYSVKAERARFQNCYMTGLVLGVTFAVTSTQAADPISTQSLSTVTVTAAENTDSLIDQEVIERSQARDIRDLFKLQTGINIGGGVSNAQKIYLRGIEDVNLNITIDGARQNVNLFHHQGRMKIDPDLLKTIDVEAGPGSADSGYAALGGSIAFTTKDADDLLQADETIGAIVKAAYADADSSKSGYTTVFGKVTEDIGVLAYFKNRNSNDLNAGDNIPIPNTAGEQQSYLLKISQNKEIGHSFSISAESHTNTGNYNNRANFPWQSNVSFLAAAMNQQHSRDSYVVNHNYKDEDSWLNSKVRLYLNETGLDYLDTVPNWIDEFSSRTTGGEISNQFNFDFFGATHNLNLGLDYVRDVTKTRTSNGQSFSEKADNYGVFVQDRITLASAKLSLGARFDQYSTHYSNGEHISGDGFSPNATLTVEPLESLSLSIGYGESVRGAQLNQNLWSLPVGTVPGRGLSPDFNVDNLAPERAKKWELGAIYDAHSIFIEGDALQLSTKIYHSKIENFAKYETTGAVIDRLYNAEGDVKSEGYETQLVWNTGGLTSALSFNHTTLRDEFDQPFGDSGLQTMRKASNFGDKWILDNRYQFSNLALELGYTVTHVSKLTDVPPGSTQKPGYTLHDISATWEPLPTEDLKLQMSVHNLTDESYAEHTTLFVNGEGTQEAGRDIHFSIFYQF